MAKKGQKFRKYSAGFKLHVILDMRENGLSYHEIVRKYELGDSQSGGERLMVQRWERIYETEGAEGFMKERRGRSAKGGRPKKLLENLETVEKEELIAENRRLRMENEYLKKLDALIRAEEERNGKKPR